MRNWPATEAAVADGVRLFMLCNPHNPVGRVFDRDELGRIAALAERHDLVICSDEIHCGLVLDPATPHIPIAALDEQVARRSITLMAPSKTWNIPALYCAFAIIPDPTLRARYKRAMAGIVPHVNVLGLTATEVAYRDCGPSREALIATLRSNAARVVEAINALPGLSTTPVEATYLGLDRLPRLAGRQGHRQRRPALRTGRCRPLRRQGLRPAGLRAPQLRLPGSPPRRRPGPHPPGGHGLTHRVKAALPRDFRLYLLISVMGALVQLGQGVAVGW